MILHLADDEKVISRAIEIFDKAFPEKNLFVVDVPNSDYVFKHVELKEDVVAAVFGSSQFYKTIGDLNQYSAIVFHNLTRNKCRFIKKNKTYPAKFIWILWGFDLYSFLETKGYNLYVNKKDFNALTRLKIAVKKILQKNFYNILYAAAYKRIDICACPAKGDYELLKEKIDIDAKWQWYNYFPVDSIIRKLNLGETVSGDNILVGNSGAITNNHVEAFRLLQKFNLGSRAVITPLTYGDAMNINHVINEGKKILPENFSPVLGFLPISEYNYVIKECSIVIMPHLRQQAVGNLIILLYLGAKVYLYKKNPLFKYFKSLGLIFFSIEEDLTTTNENALIALDQDAQSRNRTITLQEFNEEKTLKEIKLMLQA
jgi:hypothetical protein